MKHIYTILILALSFSFSIAFSQTAPEIEWQSTIGGNNDDDLQSIQQTSDGGYILGGYSSSSDIDGAKGFEDYLVVKLNMAGDMEWEHMIGGDYQDFLYSIQQTTDGGYILGGWSSSGNSADKTEGSLGSSDYWVVKLNSNGAIEWQNTIGGSNGDYLNSVQQTSDGGYILGGKSFSDISGDKTEDALGLGDYWLVKLNSTGAIEWQNTIGGSEDEELSSVQLTSDGGYILGGHSASGISGDKTEESQGSYDYWVLKVDEEGNIEWQNTIGGNAEDYLRSIIQTTDGGYLLGGHSYSDLSGDKTEKNQGYVDYWIVKLNSTGNIEWQNTIGGFKGDYMRSVIQAADGGYLLGGYSVSNISGDKTEDCEGGYGDYWVVKLNELGIIKWQNTIGGNSGDFLNSVTQTTDGGYFLGGYSKSDISGDKTEANKGGYDYWVVKLFADDVCLQPSSLSVTDVTESAAKLKWDDVPEVMGYKVRYKKTGTSEWSTTHSTDNDKKISGLNPGTEYVWQVKSICGVLPIKASEWSEKQFFTTGSLRSGALEDVLFPIEVDVYPNPFISSTTISFSLQQTSAITIELFDMAGRVVHTLLHEELQSGSHEFTFDRAKLPAGIYLLKMQTPSSVMTQSIIVQ